MLEAWAQAYHRARVDYDTLLAKIAAAKAAGQPLSPAWLYQQDRLKGAISTTKVQMAKYAAAASEQVKAAQWSAVQAATKHAAKLGTTALVGAGIHGGFTELNPDNLRHLVGFLADGSPLDHLFGSLAVESAAQARQALIIGMAHGKGSIWMAQQVDAALDLPRWRAETIMRTETARVYRAAASETYQANAEVLEGWVWTAALDSRTCPACLVMDGTLHPIGSTLDGHPRCRCAMVPRTKTWAQLGVGDAPDTRPPVRSGKAWLEAQAPSVQRAILGPAKFKAWSSGQVTLDDLVARTKSPTWGTMRRERSLIEIEQGRNANWVDAVEAPMEPAPLTANPKAVRAITKALTPEQVGEALAAGDLDAQERVNYKAAHYANTQLAGWDVPLPHADEDKAAQQAAKMATAVTTKGYPSKGYSQTVAIYKAQANGTPGTKVGVVKSLTWEQKLTAQRALALHDQWLSDHLEAQLEAKAQAKAIIEALDSTLEFSSNESMKDAVFSSAHDQLLALPDGPEKDRGLAAYQAKGDAWADDVVAAQTKHAQGETWTHPEQPGTTVHVHPDGWAALTYEDSSTQYVNPHDVNTLLGHPGWAPHIEPDPAAVKAFVKQWTDWDGTFIADDAAVYEKMLGNPLKAWTPQTVADVKAALAEAKATLPWKPDNAAAFKLLEGLKAGELDEHKITGMVSDDPQGVATAKAVLEQFHAWQATQAKPEPDVDVKPNWDDVESILESFSDLSGAELASEIDELKAAYAKGSYDYDPTYKATVQASIEKLVEKQGGAVADVPEPVTGVGPDPKALQFTGQVLGTHGAKVYTDDAGTRWLFKPPKDASDGFLTTLDETASRLQARVGLNAPDTYVLTLDGRRGSIQRMFDAQPAFSGGFKPSKLSQADMAAVQGQQVLDWLLSNHDGHLEQFMRLPDGTMVGIDKGQAFRWFGQDRLAWDFHPNAAYGAPEPVYNALWREFAQGRNVDVLDPHHDGPLRDQIRAVQAVSDADLRAMLRPYAEQAAAQGKLAVRQTQPGLTKPTVPANDVEAFLDAVVARKHALQDDFNDLFDRAAKARAEAIPGWSPAKPTAGGGSKAKWVGAPKPEAPKPPDPPEVVTAHVFDPWLVKVKARYAEGPGKTSGKSLEKSHNWARVQRVIDNHDETALQELKDRNYLDDALYAEGIQAIKDARAAKSKATEGYERQRVAWEKSYKAWQRDITAWKEANGVATVLQGMDDGVLRHRSAHEGTSWANRHWSPEKWTAAERKAMKDYTGNLYRGLNKTGRDLGPQATDAANWGSYAHTVRAIDAGMPKQPIPEDVILHRGLGADSFIIDGRQTTSADTALILDRIAGTVQVDWSFMSSSVGNQAAFGYMPIQMKIRAPAGTRAAYVQAFSKVGSELEMILDRGQHYYVHAAYESHGKVILEVEIVPADFVPPLKGDGTPEVFPSAERWTH